MIIIICKTPPPIGGVTVYCARLLDNLSNSNIEYSFLRLTFKNLVLSAYKLKNCLSVHLIASHPFVRLYYSILCNLLRKKIIITYTDNVDAFPNLFLNIANKLSIRFASIPLVLNMGSLEIGQKINNNTKLISSFIPPSNDSDDLDILEKHLGEILSKHSFVFCTNAYNYRIDKFGKELYGILDLISIFNKIPNSALIISDPSGAYNEYILNNNILLKSNIKMLISSRFSFVDVIRLSHCCIRATTSDGDSLSIHEALYLNKDVICSDCVSRPPGCLLYPTNDNSALFNIILNYKSTSIVRKIPSGQNGLLQVLQIYQESHSYITNDL